MHGSTIPSAIPGQLALASASTESPAAPSERSPIVPVKKNHSWPSGYTRHTATQLASRPDLRGSANEFSDLQLARSSRNLLAKRDSAKRKQRHAADLLTDIQARQARIESSGAEEGTSLASSYFHERIQAQLDSLEKDVSFLETEVGKQTVAFQNISPLLELITAIEDTAEDLEQAADTLFGSESEQATKIASRLDHLQSRTSILSTDLENEKLKSTLTENAQSLVDDAKKLAVAGNRPKEKEELRGNFKSLVISIKDILISLEEKARDEDDMPTTLNAWRLLRSEIISCSVAADLLEDEGLMAVFSDQEAKDLKETLSTIQDNAEILFSDTAIHEFDAELEELQTQLNVLRRDIQRHEAKPNTPNFWTMKLAQARVYLQNAKKLNDSAADLFQDKPARLVEIEATLATAASRSKNLLNQIQKKCDATRDPVATTPEAIQKSARDLLEAVSKPPRSLAGPSAGATGVRRFRDEAYTLLASLQQHMPVLEEEVGRQAVVAENADLSLERLTAFSSAVSDLEIVKDKESVLNPDEASEVTAELTRIRDRLDVLMAAQGAQSLRSGLVADTRSLVGRVMSMDSANEDQKIGLQSEFQTRLTSIRDAVSSLAESAEELAAADAMPSTWRHLRAQVRSCETAANMLEEVMERLYNEGSEFHENTQNVLSSIEDDTDALLNDIGDHEFNAELVALQGLMDKLETEIQQYGRMSEAPEFWRMKIGQVMICRTRAEKLKTTANDLRIEIPVVLNGIQARASELIDRLRAQSKESRKSYEIPEENSDEAADDVGPLIEGLQRMATFGSVADGPVDPHSPISED
jgi:hypothetical protein